MSVESDALKLPLPSITSSTYRRTLNPKWNTEFVTSWTSNKCWLRFDVMDHVRILSDKPLGSGFVDVSQIHMGETREIWIPLYDKKVATRKECPMVTSFTTMPEVASRFTSITSHETPGNPDAPQSTSETPGNPSSISSQTLPPSEWGHLRIVIDVRPFPGPGRLMLMKLPELRISIEKDFYRPGDIVRGLVHYNVSTAVCLKNLEVFCSGKSLTHWSESTSDTTIEYDGKHELFKETVNLLAAPPGAGKLDLSDTSICAAFEFQLPLGLPSSNSKQLGLTRHHSEYTIGAVARSPSLFGTTQAKLNFTVLAHQEDEQTVARIVSATASPTPSPETNAQRLISFQFKKSNAKISIQAPPVVYNDQPVTMNVTVDNTEGTTIIKKLNIFIVELNRLYAANAGVWYKKESIITIPEGIYLTSGPTTSNTQNCPELPVPIGSSRTFAITLHVSKKISNTVLPGESPLYSIQHAIVATEHTSIGKSQINNAAHFPICVSGKGIVQDTLLDGTLVPKPPRNEFIGSVPAQPYAPMHSLEPYFSFYKEILTGPSPIEGLMPTPTQVRVLLFQNNSPAAYPYLAIPPWAQGTHPALAITIPPIPGIQVPAAVYIPQEAIESQIVTGAS